MILRGSFWPSVFCLLLLRSALCVVHFLVKRVLELQVAFPCLLSAAPHSALCHSALVNQIIVLSQLVSLPHTRMSI